MQRIVNRSLGLGLGLLLLGGLGGCSAKAKDWTFTDSQGSVRSLSDYKGQTVVISFSNTWCDPCQQAAVHMQAIQDRFGSHGVKVLNISSWERGNPEKWMAENGLLAADVCVIGEPSGITREWEAIHLISRGAALFKVKVYGTQMHSSITDR